MGGVLGGRGENWGFIWSGWTQSRGIRAWRGYEGLRWGWGIRLEGVWIGWCIWEGRLEYVWGYVRGWGGWMHVCVCVGGEVRGVGWEVRLGGVSWVGGGVTGGGVQGVFLRFFQKIRNQLRARENGMNWWKNRKLQQKLNKNRIGSKLKFNAKSCKIYA